MSHSVALGRSSIATINPLVWINHPTLSEPHLPFGGIKSCGYGREVSHLGIREFANQKLVVTMRTDVPIKDALG